MRTRTSARDLRIFLLALAFAGALTFQGCTSIAIALGLRVRLDDVAVKSLAARTEPGPTAAPGEQLALVVVASTPDDHSLVTVGAGQGRVLFDSFDIEPTLASLDGVGHAKIEADPRQTWGKSAHLHISLRGRPTISTDLDIPLHYNIAYRADFSGAPGASGMAGSDGIGGMSGSAGSTDPDHPSAGGNGQDGSDGGPGADGSPGQAGEAVRVWVTFAPGLHTGAAPWLQVRVLGAKRDQYFLIDTEGGRLEVDANGGAGGAGGAGGRGGRGGSGGIGFPTGNSGRDGSSGRAGSAGSPGAAGTLEIFVDPAVGAYLSCLNPVNRNGAGVMGPAPIVHWEKVAPLW